MVAPFPLAKLLTLVMRQTAKPVAKGIKSLARKNAVFRKYVCVLPAQSELRNALMLMFLIDRSGNVLLINNLISRLPEFLTFIESQLKSIFKAINSLDYVICDKYRHLAFLPVNNFSQVTNL